MQKKILLPVCCIFFSLSLVAQKDTTKKNQSINIVSSYKPVIQNAVKINFSGTQLIADTAKTVKEYIIPAQNLFYAYQPISLKPLALAQDTNLYLGIRNFIKVGFGSNNTPYINAGLSFGDGRQTLVNIYGQFISSQGKIQNQDFSQLNIKATGSYFKPEYELYGAAAVSRNEYFLYGYDHAVYEPTKDDIRQQFQEIDVKAGIRNTVSTQSGISYDPNIQVNFFTNKDQLSETTLVIDAPVEKKFSELLRLKLEAKADFTNYATKNFIPDNIKFANNVIQVAPSVEYQIKGFAINAGLIPVWSNGNFAFLPNFYAEGKLLDNGLIFQAGWVGHITKNTYRNLSKINPYLSPVFSQTNTRETEFYGGIKASFGKHFNINAKAGLVSYHDFAIFINDTSSFGLANNNFRVSYEPTMNNLRIHGDISYINQEKFTATAGLTLNGYTGLQNNAKAWNTLPMEFTGSLRWWPFERLLLKSDFYLFGGGNYLERGNKSEAFNGGSDLSIGSEYKIKKQFSAFIDVNNIFNNKYERWHKYEVYGLNLLAGIIIHF